MNRFTSLGTLLINSTRANNSSSSGRFFGLSCEGGSTGIAGKETSLLICQKLNPRLVRYHLNSNLQNPMLFTIFKISENHSDLICIFFANSSQRSFSRLRKERTFFELKQPCTWPPFVFWHCKREDDENESLAKYEIKQ